VSLLRKGSRSGTGPQPVRRPIFYADIVVSNGAELRQAMIDQGFSTGDYILKYCWPRFAPPADSGIRSLLKSEHLGLQFERLMAMHRVVPAHIPMPAARVTSPEGEFAGYLLEYVSGETLSSLISFGMLDEARRQLALVETTLGKLHAKSLPHGDVNGSNVIAADDGRTLLIDPVANPGSGARLQDELCLVELRAEIEARVSHRSEPDAPG
jgi:hypothetical protein